MQVIDQTASANVLYLAAVTWQGANTPTVVLSGSATNKSFTATPLANNWWRFDNTYTAGTTANDQLRVIIYPESTGTGTGKGIYIYGVQVTNTAFGVDYIPTTTVAVLQNADIISLPFAQTAFTALLKTLNLNITNGTQRLLGLNTGNAPIYLLSNTQFATYGSALGTVNSPIFSNNVYTSNNKVMVTGNSSYRAITADGLVPNTSTNAIVSATPTTMYIGSDGSADLTDTYGNFLQFGIWFNIVASNTELETNTL